MSSDSELEEFYDATDETPNISLQPNDQHDEASRSPIQSNTATTPSNLDEKWLTDLEREEEELLLLKKRAEERRRQEDQEIAIRLARLKKHKSDIQTHTEQKGDRSSDRHSDRHSDHSNDSSPESRITKLKRLRQQFSEDQLTHHLDDPLPLDHHDPYSPITTSGDVFYTKQETDANKTTDKLTEISTQSKWTDADLHELVREACEVVSTKSTSLNRDADPAFKGNYRHRETKEEGKSSSLGRENETSRKSTDLNDLSDYLISGLKLTKSASFPTYEEGSPNEPDIVKSTRVTPPQTLAPAPVAPPRRKKRQHTTEMGDSDGGSITPVTETAPSLPRPPRPSVPPTTRRDTASMGMEYSLDVDSAIGGNRLIHADDIEVDATTSSHPGSRVNSLERGVLLRKTSLDYLCDLSSARPRSNSGRSLTDQEILESVMVLNLDTGEQVPLSVAEEKLPQCANPLTLHIMRRTQEYNSHSSLNKAYLGSDDDDDCKSVGGKSTGSMEFSTKLKAEKLKRLIGRSVKSSVKKVKQVAEQSKKGIAEVLEGDDTEMENEVSVDGKKFKFKRSRGNKGPYSFAQFRILQDLSGHTGAVWTMEFSPCGRLLATGGQDNMLRVWVLKSSFAYFDEMRIKSDARLSPAQSLDSLDSQSSDNTDATDSSSEERRASFMKKPLWVYRGHTADLLDIAWSKNNFILSSSMDKTVRLWHISRRECLCTFQHIDFVTAIVFHPRDDRYFLSGSLDGNLRLWNIPDKKVTLRNEVSGQSSLITTANFCDNGRYAVVGMYDGRCILFHTDKLKYYTQINVRSTRGKNRGRKITGVEPIRLNNKNLMLVTSNDSRIRLYDLRDLTLTCKFKGHINNSSQIKASFSGNGQSIICGSEDHFVYVWKTQHDYHKMSSARRDRNHYWEAIKVHNAVVTTAIFASKPELFSKTKDESNKETKSIPENPREIIVSADFNGLIKIVQNHTLVTT